MPAAMQQLLDGVPLAETGADSSSPSAVLVPIGSDTTGQVEVVETVEGRDMEP